MSYVKAFVLNWKDKLASFFLSLVAVWIIFAICFQMFFVYLEFSGKDELQRDIVNWIEWRIDGTFKNDPVNIWYEAEDHVWVDAVENQVKIGKLA